MAGGSSRSQQHTQTTSTLDNSNILAEENGVAIRGSNNQINYSDKDAIRESFDFAREAGIVFSETSESIANRSIDTNADIVGRSLNSVDDAVYESFNFAGKSVGDIKTIADRALGFAGNTVNRSLDSVDEQYYRALDFSGDNISKSFDLVRNTQEGSIELVGGILDRITQNNERVLTDLSAAQRNFARDLSTFAESQSTNNDERITQIAKWAMIATIAMIGFNAIARGRRA